MAQSGARLDIEQAIDLVDQRLTKDRLKILTEPPRVFRRLFGLSYAAMGMASSWA